MQRFKQVLCIQSATIMIVNTLTVFLVLGYIKAGGCGINNLTQYDQVRLKVFNEKCVLNKFSKGSDCDGALLLSNFADQQFDFRDVFELRRFATWIELLDNIQRFAPQSHTLTNVTVFLDKFVRIDSTVTRALQLAGDVVYENVAALYANNRAVARFGETWLSFQNFFNSYIIWSPLRYKTLLAMYARVRKSVRHWRHLITDVDDACERLITLTLEYPLATMNQRYIRQEAYIYYVSKLNKVERNRFSGLYETIETEQFPQTTILHSGPVNISLHHDIHNLDTLNRMQEECNFVYGNFKALWQRLNVSFVHNVRDVDVYVYKNRTEYKRTGLLLTDSVDNGGVSVFHYKPKKIQASVYFDDNQEIPHAFGHELFHCLLYTSNRRVLHRSNSRWYLEGAANRFGFRKCFWRDYFDLRAYQHKTIEEIVHSDYGDKILYPMGSALVSFLYEKRPDILRKAVLDYNYTIVADARLEKEFIDFKQNKLAECDYVRRHQTAVPNTVQAHYVGAVSNETFRHCRNYIAVHFDDCVFVLTPTRLYIENNVRVGATVNVQKIIRYSRNEVTQFDFDFMQKGLIKLVVRYLLNDTVDPHNIVDKFFSVDDKYTYAANVSCGIEQVATLMLALPMRRATLLAKAKDIDSARNIVRRLEQTVLSCQLYTPPAVNVSGRLRTYVEHLFHLRDEHIATVNLIKPLDVRGNTILHLSAILNKPLFLRLCQHHYNLTVKLLNYDNRTPVWLFENTQKYIQYFKHEPSRYCMAVVPGNYSFKHKPISALNNTQLTKKFVVNQNKTLYAASIVENISRKNITKIIENNKTHGNVLVYNSIAITIVVVVVVVVVVVIIVISFNTFITIKIVKYHINKANNQTLDFNKHKFYNNNECTIPLFN